MVVFSPTLVQQPRKELGGSIMPVFEAGRSALDEMLTRATVRAIQIQNILSSADTSVIKTSSRINKKLAPILFIVTLLLASCGPQITAADLAKYQGSFSGTESEALTGGDYEHHFFYESVVPKMTADALARQVPQEDINLALASPRETRFTIGSGTTCATASVEKNEGGDNKITPATLHVNEIANGVCHVEVVGVECISGTNTCTMPATFSVNITTDRDKPQVAFNQPTMTTDGNGLVLYASATDNVGVTSLSVSANGQQIPDQDPNPQVFSATINPIIGTVDFTATAIDNVQNNTSVSQRVINELVAENTTALQTGDKIIVEGDTRGTLTPAINVVIKQCGTGVQMGAAPVDGTTKKFSTAVAPTNTGDVCVDVVPVNSLGQEGSISEIHTPYTIETPQVVFQLDPNDPGKLIVLANTPDSLNDSTFRAWGQQPKWKQGGAIGEFTCDNLQVGGVDMGGQKYDLKMSCSLPSGDVGDPTIFFDIQDNNGFSFRGSFPMSSQTKLDLRDDPGLLESVAYWGGLMTLLIAGLSGTGALGLFLTASHDNLKVAGKMREARRQLDGILAVERGKRWANAYTDFYTALTVADQIIDQTTSGLRGVLKGTNREKYRTENRAANDTLRIIATSEQIAESIQKIRISEDLLYPQFIPDIVDAVTNLDLLYQQRPGKVDTDVRKTHIKKIKYKLKEWIDTFAFDGSKPKDISKIMEHNSKPLTGNILKLLFDIQVQRKGKYHHLWEDLTRDDPSFAQELQDLAICYAAVTQETAGQTRLPALSIEGNRQRLLRSVRHRQIGERELVKILSSRGFIVQVENMIATYKSPEQKISAAEGFLDVGNLNRAGQLLSEIPNKMSALAPVQRRIIVAFATQWQNGIYAILPPNYKYNLDLIRAQVRVALTNSHYLPQFESYIESISLEIQKKNMQVI